MATLDDFKRVFGEYKIINNFKGVKMKEMTAIENMVTREFKKLGFVDEVKFGVVIEKKCMVIFKTTKETHDEKKINKLISQELKIRDKLPGDVFIDFEYSQKRR